MLNLSREGVALTIMEVIVRGRLSSDGVGSEEEKNCSMELLEKAVNVRVRQMVTSI